MVMNMKITIRPYDLMDRGVWDKYCELTGTNVWAVNEGLIRAEEELALTEKQAKELGIIK